MGEERCEALADFKRVGHIDGPTAVLYFTWRECARACRWVNVEVNLSMWLAMAAAMSSESSRRRLPSEVAKAQDLFTWANPADVALGIICCSRFPS